MVAYVEAYSTLSCLELTALEGIQETLAALAETANTASATNALEASNPAPAKTQGPQVANEVQQEAAYAHVGGEKRPPCSVGTPRSTAKGLPAKLAKTQLDSQPDYVDSERPKASPANYGMKMMMKNGWKPGQGLGVRCDGITEPVLTTEQLVPDRKDYNPGVGSRTRMEHQVSRRTSSAASQASNAQVNIVFASLPISRLQQALTGLGRNCTPVRPFTSPRANLPMRTRSQPLAAPKVMRRLGNAPSTGIHSCSKASRDTPTPSATDGEGQPVKGIRFRASGEYHEQPREAI